VEDRSTRFGIDPYRGSVPTIWQGTLLRSHEDPSLHRLVISADCDLLGDKGAGEFFCLDVHSSEHFLKASLRNECRDDLSEEIVAAARDIAKAKASAFSEMSSQVLRDWLLYGNENRWKADLHGIHGNDLVLLSSLSQSLRRIQDGAGAEILLACSIDQLSGKVQSINKKLKAVIRARLTPTRADLYVLPSIPGQEDQTGHFVSFKSLALMRRADVAQSKIEVLEKPKGYSPVATCRPILLQSLLQKLTTYFTRIGLTNTFRAEQEAVLEEAMGKVT